MPTLRNELGIIVYAPALGVDDNRPLSIVRGMERAFPGLRLEWTISDEGRRVPLPQRDEWLSKETKDGGFPLLCNGDESNRVSVTAWERPAGGSPGGRAQFEVHAALPSNTAGIAAAVDMLEAIAEGARAFWGHATPFNAGVEISRQSVHPIRKPGVPPPGLPALKLREDIRAPEIPHRLGWLNHWSAATARVIGFPDPARDSEWISRARSTATGGWILQLTDTPLDLDDPAHLEKLLRTYERFPKIGGRSEP